MVLKYAINLFQNRAIISILFFSFCLSTFTQTKEDAFRDAKITAKATLNFDFKTVLKHTYPPIVKVMGGKEKAISFMEKTFKEMENSNGFKFEKAEIMFVSNIIKEQNEYRCYVKNNNQMLINKQRIKSESYLLGIYNEVDKFWYFIEAKQIANQTINQILPGFKTDLAIPQGKVSVEKI